LSPGIDSKEVIPAAYLAWRAGTITFSYLVPSPHRFFKNSSSVHVVPPLGRRFLAFLSLNFIVSDMMMIFNCFELSTPSTIKKEGIVE
jgi:hypothetical protein